MPKAEALCEARSWLRLRPPGSRRTQVERGGPAVESVKLTADAEIYGFSYPYCWVGFVLIGESG